MFTDVMWEFWSGHVSPTANMGFREQLNGALFPTCLILAATLLVFLTSAWNTADHHMRQWRSTPGITTACILFWVFFAEALRSGNVWLIYRLSQSQNGLAIGPLAWWSTITFIVTGFIMLAAILKGIHFFTPPPYGNRVVALAFFGTLAFLSISHILK